MANELVLMPSIVLNTLEGAVCDLNDVGMQRWPDQPTGQLTSRDQIPPLALDATVAQLPEIEVFEHINFEGRSWRTNRDYLYVGDWWNDRISSMIIVRGRWRFYQHSAYRGAYWDLSSPSRYPWVEDANIPNDMISSFRVIG